MYRRVLFQGNGSDIQKNCFEQHRITGKCPFECFVSKEDLLAFEGSSSMTHVAYIVKALLRYHDSEVLALCYQAY